MAATFSNPRLAANPCELMRGCIFAENYITATKMGENLAVAIGSGNSVDHGYTSAGTGYFTFDYVEIPGSFSVVHRFSAAALDSEGYLISSASLINGTPVDGFALWVDSDGVKANYSDGVSIPTRCAVDIDYSDGETHTVTYVVDQDNNTHSLYVDGLTADIQAATTNGPIGAARLIIVSNGLAATHYKSRVFNQILTAEEHALYHADTMLDFMDQPLAVYRCDQICDDSVGHKIWDRTLKLNDLYKADRATTSKFPTFNVDRYEFDLVDDYLTNWPTLPTDYTVVAALATPQLPWPVIRQENDSTLIDELGTEGTYWGYLHNLAIHTVILTQLQLYHAEYMHMYMLSRGRASGLFHRLITEDSCRLSMFMDYPNAALVDHSEYGNSGPGINGITSTVDGVTFPNATSHVHVNHDSSLQLQDVSIVCQIEAVAGVSCTLVDKGTNYKFRTTATTLDFNGSTISHTLATGDHQVAVVCKSGYEPRFFVNKAYIGEGSSTVTPDDTDTTDLTIGNNNELNERCQHTLKNVFISDKTLSDAEIRAMGNMAEYIGAQEMEAGARTSVPKETFTAVAVDYDVTPGTKYQLIDLVMVWNVAPTTSEDLVIFSIREGVKITEASYDPSLSSELQHMFRFDKRLGNVSYGVDYTNTDGRTIDVYSTYQEDPSV